MFFPYLSLSDSIRTIGAGWLVVQFGCGTDQPNHAPFPYKNSGSDTDTDSDDVNDTDTDSDSGSSTDTGTAFARPSNPTCLAPERPPSPGGIALTRVYSDIDLDDPIFLYQAPDDDSRWFAGEQGGMILSFDTADGASSTEEVLDLSSVVYVSYETGLLGLAFHPNFATNGEAFVSYNLYVGSDLLSRISRFTSTDSGATLDRDSEEIILEFEQPYSNHNGGEIAFGPDGYLYFGMGDGGWYGDPLESGQDTDTMLGAILRIDPDGGSPYSIPEDNPFADGSGAEEIYAWGFRNPWRFTFDPATGDLWVGDVGQYNWEEVDRVELGGNYGWNIKEGTACYSEDPCDFGWLLDPEVEYPNPGDASVVMGRVYRGSAIPSLVGTPLFTDFYDGVIRGIVYDEVSGEPEIAKLSSPMGLYISAFGQDADGEVYALDYSSGRIYRIDSADEEVQSDFPDLLSETGCVDPDDPTQPASGLIEYGVNVAFWSDGAEKDRWMALPDGETITVGDDGDWVLPVGSVLVKQFTIDEALVETRLLVRHDDGNWAGYTFAWNDEGTDAEWVSAGDTLEIGETSWSLPSTSQCLRCHTEVSGGSLGLQTEQFNGDFTYPNGKTTNQLVMLTQIGMFDTPVAIDESEAATLTALPSLEGSADTEDKARAILHVNCAMCHQADGQGGGDSDLLYSTALEEMNICGELPTYGDLNISDPRIVAPGDADRSILSLRMHALDVHRMPPLGSSVVDESGTEIIDAWIEGMTSTADGEDPDCSW